ncbi:MAG: hypothetical protein GTO63_23750, partial [Anaerolineae bacterium]|nr:hypothetical protein [Anaerolineae bacterium]NIN97737.1 hypothetical protein [Anaerolineae bacterium]NIQ80722.1 hypothetical protein [Anaerolineae bacterium]
DLGQIIFGLQDQRGQVVFALEKTRANATVLLTQAKHAIHLTTGQQLTGYLTYLLNEVLHLHTQ